MPVLFALSPSHFVSNVGADAGFAALIGLAILVLLYFAHAREISSLRNQLSAATERLDELERRLATGAAASARQPIAGSAPTVAPRPPLAAPAEASPVSSAAPAASPQPVTDPPHAAPAGLGAPPLSDATRVVPFVDKPAGDSTSLPADGRGAGAAVHAAPLAAPGGTPAGATGRTAVQSSPPLSPEVGKTPSPVTAAAGGNGFSAARAATDAAASERSLLDRGAPGHSRRARWLISVLALVVLVVVAVILVLVLGSGNSHHNATVHHRRAADIAAAPPGVVPSTVTFSVVNATTINQLAHHVGDRLTAGGFNEGTLATDTSQSLTKTVVGYLPRHREDALAVAHTLRLPASDVRPVMPSSLGLVCPSVSACATDVVVTAGSDVAPTQ